MHESTSYINGYDFGLVLAQVYGIRKERFTFQKYGIDEVLFYQIIQSIVTHFEVTKIFKV